MNKLKIAFVILLLSICSSVASLFPLINSGKDTGLFSFEPDVPYVANAISYVYTDNIIYSAHPATPTIVLLSYSMIPLRIYSKVVHEIPFFTWTIRNQSFLYQYERYFISLVFAIGIVVFLSLIYKLSRSIILVVASWLALFSYTNTPYLGIIIQSEPLSFLILSVWLLFFYYFVKKRNIKLYIVLCFLSGLAFANKLPNMFFVFASISFFVFLKFKSLKNAIKNLVLGLFTSMTSFFIFTWPIRTQYEALLSWVKHLLTHSGVHGRGGFEIFNMNTQLTNLKTLFSIETTAGFILIAIVIFWLFKNKKFDKNFVNPLNVFLLWIVLGIFIFSKFPLSHYHQFHFLALISIGSYLLSKTSKIFHMLIVIPLLFTAHTNITNYWDVNINEVKKSMELEKFVKNNTSQKGIVWEWGRSIDYSLLHTRDWICNPYESYLSDEKPNLYSLTTNMDEAIVNCATKVPLFDVCWDKLYIQESEMPRFLDKYKNKKVITNKIEGSKNMWVITSNHCKNE